MMIVVIMNEEYNVDVVDNVYTLHLPARRQLRFLCFCEEMDYSTSPPFPLNQCAPVTQSLRV